MSRRRFPVGIVLPVFLIGLVGALATFQYRWLGQVSEAEREQLSRSLTQRAREFTEDFDRELTRLYFALQLSRQSVADQSWATFAEAYDTWRRSARHPQVVRGIYLADWAEHGIVLRPYDEGGRRFADVPLAGWPDDLEPLRQRYLLDAPPIHLPGPPPAAVRQPAPPGSGTLQVVTMAVSSFAPDVPALVIPVVTQSGSGAVATPMVAPAGQVQSSAVFRWIDARRSAVVVHLDDTYLSETVLPALAARHFPADGGDAYRLAVTGPSGEVKYQRGFATGAAADVAQADVSMALFTLRADLVPDVLRHVETAVARSPGGPPVSSGIPGAAGRTTATAQYSFIIASDARTGTAPGVRARIQTTRPAWTLRLQHAAGSLDEAVSRARLRNLWLSFTILGVLAVGMLLVVRNARRSEQLAARQMDFVATVSHELRTPLAVIRSAAQNLSAGVIADPAQARRYGELIDNEGRRLTDMVEQVMDYAGLEGQRRVRSPRPVDVLSVVEDAAASCRPVCEAAGCELEVDLGDPDEDLPAVMGDEAALGRVVANLITNAAKHGADGRWVGVKVSSCEVKNGREVQVSVSDRGRGIEAAELSRIFEPFRRGRHAVEQQVHGNGLGLSLVKRIVEAHGGRVAVTSTPGEGATFVVYLPAVPESAVVSDARQGVTP
jgi:signal transduction histidine kinase